MIRDNMQLKMVVFSIEEIKNEDNEFQVTQREPLL
jgi:hypothetical protein